MLRYHQGRAVTKVLVVEDDAVSHCIVTSSLRRRGFDIVSATDAESAIRILERHHDIALVFSDVVMPGEMDGSKLQEWIRTNRAGLPVILGSADPARAQPTGHPEFRFFSKPYNIDAIATCIRSLTR
jgi:CheY-like chemotaxis protein